MGGNGNTIPLLPPNFKTGVDLGRFESSAIREASGVALSRLNDGVMWVHNDSGDSNRLFAMTTSGNDLGYYTVDGAIARDWEDMAVGPGPEEGTQYIYIGDIGNNSGSRDVLQIYRVPEPQVSIDQASMPRRLGGAETISITYGNGNRNAETLMVDPITLDIYVVEKKGVFAWLYRAAYPQDTRGVNTLEYMGRFPHVNNATGGDMSPDGNEFLINTYQEAFLFQWPRGQGIDIKDVISEMPIAVPYTVVGGGEAIGWAPDGRGYSASVDSSPSTSVSAGSATNSTCFLAFSSAMVLRLARLSS